MRSGKSVNTTGELKQNIEGVGDMVIQYAVGEK